MKFISSMCSGDKQETDWSRGPEAHLLNLVYTVWPGGPQLAAGVQGSAYKEAESRGTAQHTLLHSTFTFTSGGGGGCTSPSTHNCRNIWSIRMDSWMNWLGYMSPRWWRHFFVLFVGNPVDEATEPEPENAASQKTQTDEQKEALLSVL